MDICGVFVALGDFISQAPRYLIIEKTKFYAIMLYNMGEVPPKTDFYEPRESKENQSLFVVVRSGFCPNFEFLVSQTMSVKYS